MLDIISGIILGISAYVSTNIDNLFILLTFQTDCSASKIRILSGYAAWVLVMLASMLVFSLVRDFIPVNFLELLGIIPLLMGFKKLYSLLLLKK
jgi:cadmium resistance protein CadD (predicted permease)